MGKKMIIYVKSSTTSNEYFHMADVKCYCGDYILPGCKKCKNCDRCNVIDALRKYNLNVEYNPNSSNNRTATIIVKNIKELGRAYKMADQAMKFCCCKPKQKTK